MTAYIIQDTNIGFIQWIAEGAASPEDALAQFDAEVGIDPDGKGLDVDDWRITEATPEMVAEAENWAESGHPAPDAPEWA